MNMGKRIEIELRNQDLSLEALCRRAPDSLDYNAIYALMRRDSRKSKDAGEIAWALGVHIGWLQDGHEPKYNPESPYCPCEQRSELVDTLPLRRTREVPAVGDVKGGSDGYFEEHQYQLGHGEGVIDYPTTDHFAYALRVKGDSMNPRYRAGEFIIVEPSIEPQPGEDVVVICHDGRKLLKVLAWVRGDSVSLLSINNGHLPLTLDTAEIDRMHPVAGSVPARALRKR